MGREMRGLDGEGRREGATENAQGGRRNAQAVTASKKRHGARGGAPWRSRQAAAETSVETDEMVFRIWEAIW